MRINYEGQTGSGVSSTSTNWLLERVDLVFATARKLAERGAAVLMVEQNVKKALLASDRGYVLELGRVQLSDRAAALIGDARVGSLYMGRRVGSGAHAATS